MYLQAVHKYRQNRPFPIKITWGFIGNGRNVSICEQAWGWQGKTGWGGRPGWGWLGLRLARAQIGRGGSWHVGRRLTRAALIERPTASKGG